MPKAIVAVTSLILPCGLQNDLTIFSFTSASVHLVYISNSRQGIIFGEPGGTIECGPR